jgi:hypothetical protein
MNALGVGVTELDAAGCRVTIRNTVADSVADYDGFVVGG